MCVRAHACRHSLELKASGFLRSDKQWEKTSSLFDRFLAHGAALPEGVQNKNEDEGGRRGGYLQELSGKRSYELRRGHFVLYIECFCCGGFETPKFKHPC